MTFDIYSSQGVWEDILPYVSYQGITATRNDVDGASAGRNQKGDLIRDRIAVKQKYQINTPPITKARAMWLSALVAPETFKIRTDYDTATVVEYTVYSNNVQRIYIYKGDDGQDYMKLSFPIIEV